MAAGAYTLPDWAEPYPAEDTDAVSLDVVKTGTIVDTVALPRAQSFCTFGRSEGADILLEHPSSSRLHAVLQFRGREVYLVDCGSTHGTFLNNAALEARKYYAVHVGAQFRFGQSSRSYIFSAPEVCTLSTIAV